MAFQLKKTGFQDPTLAKTNRSNFTQAHDVGGDVESGATKIRPNLNSLILDKRYQVSRYYDGAAVTSGEWVEQLAALLADDNVDLDPIDVFEIDGQLWVAHGYSRTAAYKLAGRDTIPAVKHPGGHKEAMALALRANAKSQKATSLDDKWAHCWHTLVFYGFAESDKQLSKLVDQAFSYRFVKTVRDSHEALLRVWKQYGRKLAQDKVTQLCEGVPAHFITLVLEHEWINLPEEGQALDKDEQPQPQIRMAHRTLPNGEESVYAMKTGKIGQHKKVKINSDSVADGDGSTTPTQPPPPLLSAKSLVIPESAAAPKTAPAKLVSLNLSEAAANALKWLIYERRTGDSVVIADEALAELDAEVKRLAI